MKYLGHGMLFNLLPLGFVFLMAIFGICAFSIRRIPIIRSVYAVGGNEDAARMMGISVFKSRITAHIICSVLACLAGINVRLPGLATDMICWPLPLWSSEGYP